jgi:hypothetical protein
MRDKPVSRHGHPTPKHIASFNLMKIFCIYYVCQKIYFCSLATINAVTQHKMKAQINENIAKSKQWLTLTISHKDEIVFYKRFDGQNCYEEFLSHLKLSPATLATVEHLSCYRNTDKIDYINKFFNINTLDIRGGRKELIFPNLTKNECIKRIFINDQLKPTKLLNISTAKKLEEIFIGDFTFGKPVEIVDFNEILSCSNLKNLNLSNAKFEVEDLKKLKDLKSLAHLSINQKFDVKDLAKLSKILTNVECNELRAWQSCETPFGDVKINGKRMPYLNSLTDKERIKMYEIEFERLKNKLC